jgi:hypothetical protein
MGTLYPGNITASVNPGNIASTSTLHPGNTSGNIIYVDASSPYPWVVSMGNLGTSLTTNLPYLGGAHPLWVTWGFLLTPHRPTQTQAFSNRITKPWLTVPTHHTGTCVPHGPIPNIYFPRTPAYVTPNPRVEGEVDDGVRDQFARTLREFRFTPKGRAMSYQKPYPEYIDTIPYPRGFWVPDLAKFTGDDAKTTYEHIG